ncbi:MAG: hypothetical protein A2289_27095 [Deltaproteobacteria bacterium RIFOXYA12_FULL_58_15]|nr:MAG: hypothetical protein A2289_27095 [Deltaproteobacteria bacterium RIFOXYA12_FULL_58_15]OGR12088.1 MAG: hypothetical protein A2341_18330 [Deltaproteobacteria bacterium RIFOXYB12_FULL_58_9]
MMRALLTCAFVATAACGPLLDDGTYAVQTGKLSDSCASTYVGFTAYWRFAEQSNGSFMLTDELAGLSVACAEDDGRLLGSATMTATGNNCVLTERDDITNDPEGDRFTGTLTWTVSSSCTSATCVIAWSLDGNKQ